MERSQDILTGHVAIELDGPSVSPENVDVPLLLELAAAYFSLLQANAAASGLNLELRALKVIDKCVAIACPVLNMEEAVKISAITLQQLSGNLPARRGSGILIDRLRSSVRRLPQDLRARLMAGSWEADLVLPPDENVPPNALVALRAKVIKVTGEPHATVRLKSELEKNAFTLDVSTEQATKLGYHLLQMVDFDAEVSRDVLGDIVHGRLLSFDPVQHVQPEELTRQWRDWYRRVGKEWDEIADIEGELERWR